MKWTLTPRPLEETDPVLAEHLRLVVNGQHPVKSLMFGVDRSVLIAEHETRIIEGRKRYSRDKNGTIRRLK